MPFFTFANASDVDKIDGVDVDSQAANDSRSNTIKYTPITDAASRTFRNSCNRFLDTNILGWLAYELPFRLAPLFVWPIRRASHHVPDSARKKIEPNHLTFIRICVISIDDVIVSGLFISYGSFAPTAWRCLRSHLLLNGKVDEEISSRTKENQTKNNRKKLVVDSTE